MITLYTWSTANGRKISIALEELALPYTVRAIDINKDEQFGAEFLAVSPNNKIPAIVDDETPAGAAGIFESGAILEYLADKTGRLLAPSGPARTQALSWLHWQTSGLGPTLGQLGFFAVRSKDKPPEAIERFTVETRRLLGVLDARLQNNAYVAGDDYSIADIANYTWCHTASTLLKFVAPTIWGDLPALEAWLARVGQRPAVQRGMAVPG